MTKIFFYNSDGSSIEHLNQNDKDVTFVISDVVSSVVPVLQICNRWNTTTLDLDYTTDASGGMTATIPNELLAQAEVIIFYICQYTEDGIKRTLEEIRVHVRPYREEN